MNTPEIMAEAIEEPVEVLDGPESAPRPLPSAEHSLPVRGWLAVCSAGEWLFGLASVLVALAFLVMSYPGRGDPPGTTWEVVSALFWHGFLLTFLLLLVLSVMAALHRFSSRRRRIRR